MPIGDLSRANAREILRAFLKPLGLGSLVGWAMDLAAEAGDVGLALQMIQTRLPETRAFRARFPAYDELVRQGRAMSPAEIIAYERAVAQIMHAAGIPRRFYDRPDDFARLLVANVSPAEVQDRVRLVAQAVNADTETIRQLRSLFGVTRGELTAFFLDPDRALPLIQERWEAAQAAGAASRTGFGDLSRDQAMRLAALNVTAEDAQVGFAELAANRGLFEVTVGEQRAGETDIGRGEQIEATFGGNQFAADRIRRRRERRVAEFSGSAGFGVSGRGVVGLGSPN